MHPRKRPLPAFCMEVLPSAATRALFLFRQLFASLAICSPPCHLSALTIQALLLSFDRFTKQIVLDIFMGYPLLLLLQKVNFCSCFLRPDFKLQS